MSRRLSRLLGVTVLAATMFSVACSGGSDGRKVEIAIDEQACTPATIDAKAGEALALAVTNRSSGDREVEGIEGTKLNEVVVPAGRSRTLNYTVPDAAGTQKVKCYAPGGATTIIEIVATK